MPAFELAVQQGAQMIEFDVRPTSDGQIIVFHDDTTERWNGRPQRVDQLLLNAVRRLNIGGAQVPTFDELCAWACSTDLLLNVELKVPYIEEAVAETIRCHQLQERVIVSSFSPLALHRMRRIVPELARGVLTSVRRTSAALATRPLLLAQLRRQAAQAWHPDWRLPQLTRMIERVRRAGFAVNVWTVDDPLVMRRLLELGVDGIMTNRPARLREVQQQWATERNRQ